MCDIARARFACVALDVLELVSPPSVPAEALTDLEKAVVVCGDASEWLVALPENSVDLFFTSPPYADARPYCAVRPDDYVEWFEPFAEAMLEATADSGSMVVNIKNRVASSGPLRGQRHPYVFELVLRLQSLGWRWLETYVWHKPNAVPGRFGPRSKDSFEFCFHFSKGFRPYFDLDAVRVPYRADAAEIERRRRDTRGRRNTEAGFGRDRSKVYSPRRRGSRQCRVGAADLQPAQRTRRRSHGGHARTGGGAFRQDVVSACWARRGPVRRVGDDRRRCSCPWAARRWHRTAPWVRCNRSGTRRSRFGPFRRLRAASGPLTDICSGVSSVASGRLRRRRPAMTFGWSRSHPPMRTPERHRAVTPDRTECGVSSGSRGGEWALPAMVCGVLALLLVVAGAGTSLGWWAVVAAAVLVAVTVVYLEWSGRLDLSRLFTAAAPADETSFRSESAGGADQTSTQSAGFGAAGADTRPDPSQRTRVERRSAGPLRCRSQTDERSRSNSTRYAAVAVGAAAVVATWMWARRRGWRR